MNSLLKKHIISVFLFFLSVGILQGCDQVKILTGYFTEKKTAPSSQAAQKTQSLAASLTESQAKDAAGAPAAKPAKNIFIRVGDWQMTIEEFKERTVALKELVPEYDASNMEQNKLIVEELVRQQLLVQEAERQGLGKNKDVEQAVEEFRRTLLVRELAMKIASGVEATEDEAKEFYETNKADFQEPGEWKIREIIVATEEEAKDLLVALYQGADFAQMAREKSSGKTAAEGGDLGYVTEFPFQKMRDVILTLEPGEISRSFKGPDGFYLVKLEQKKGGELKDFAEMKQEIKEGLTMLKQQDVLLKYITDLRQKTQVDINFKLLEEKGQ